MIDGGEFVAHSHPVAIPVGINVVGMHRITWPRMGSLIRREVGTMLEAANHLPGNVPVALQQEAVAYRTAGQRTWAERIAA